LEERVVDKEGLKEQREEFKKVVQGVRGEGLELKEMIVGLGMLCMWRGLIFREGCCSVDKECEDAVAASRVDMRRLGVGGCRKIEKIFTDHALRIVGPFVLSSLSHLHAVCHGFDSKTLNGNDKSPDVLCEKKLLTCIIDRTTNMLPKL
jgi:hypothetical protein